MAFFGLCKCFTSTSPYMCLIGCVWVTIVVKWCTGKPLLKHHVDDYCVLTGFLFACFLCFLMISKFFGLCNMMNRWPCWNVLVGFVFSFCVVLLSFDIKFFVCEGGCCCLPGRCLWQREICGVQERIGCSPLWWSISQCPLSCFGQQDWYPRCCLRRWVAFLPGSYQLHHRQG